MRSWVMQPGTMITHCESVKYAGTTFLGAIALIAALMAMLYTTASDALGKLYPSRGSSPCLVEERAAKLVMSLTEVQSPQSSNLAG